MARTQTGLAAWLALLVLPFAPVPASAQSAITADELRTDIAVLASDDYGGRAPGTRGEQLTTAWLADQWAKAGFKSGTNDPLHPWFAPVEIVERQPAGHSVSLRVNGRMQSVPADAVFASGFEAQARIDNAPVVLVADDWGLDGIDDGVAGMVAIIRDMPDRPDSMPDAAARRDALFESGAAAVVTILNGTTRLVDIRPGLSRPQNMLASAGMDKSITVFAEPSLLDMLGSDAGRSGFFSGGGDAPRLRKLDASITIEIANRLTRLQTHNVIARLPGRRPSTGAVLLMGHWDHLGECRGPEAADRICNGAIDNASGLAVITALARRLGSMPRMDRDIYLLATTGEEKGLLGAYAFAENPPLPLTQIAVAFNLDMVALSRPNDPVVIVGRGSTTLDKALDKLTKRAGRKFDRSDKANVFLRRQDGWALQEFAVPTVMVGATFSHDARLQDFLDTHYHAPGDELHDGLDLTGAAADANLHLRFVKHFADASKFRLGDAQVLLP